jgi:hypothetical protein
MERPLIGGKDFHNFHWKRRISSKRGHGELGVKGVVYCVFFLGVRGIISYVFFLGKRRKTSCYV